MPLSACPGFGTAGKGAAGDVTLAGALSVDSPNTCVVGCTAVSGAMYFTVDNKVEHAVVTAVPLVACRGCAAAGMRAARPATLAGALSADSASTCVVGCTAVSEAIYFAVDNKVEHAVVTAVPLVACRGCAAAGIGADGAATLAGASSAASASNCVVGCTAVAAAIYFAVDNKVEHAVFTAVPLIECRGCAAVGIDATGDGTLASALSANVANACVVGCTALVVCMIVSAFFHFPFVTVLGNQPKGS